MTPAQFNKYCASLPATTHVVQWGDADVWKVGGKVFAVGGWGDTSGRLAFSFKTTREGYAVLVDLEGMRPAPYLASRGMSWVQHYAPGAFKLKDLKALIAESHRLVSQGSASPRLSELWGKKKPALTSTRHGDAFDVLQCLPLPLQRLPPSLLCRWTLRRTDRTPTSDFGFLSSGRVERLKRVGTRIWSTANCCCRCSIDPVEARSDELVQISKVIAPAQHVLAEL